MMPKHLTIIVIDDDEDDKEIFCEVLHEIDVNFLCVTASNGEDGLTLLKSISPLPDYIFLDLNMPRMNGKQCLVQIKKLEKYTAIPVIIYSTSKSHEDKEETKQLGATHFLTKPNSMGQLKKELEALFDVI